MSDYLSEVQRKRLEAAEKAKRDAELEMLKGGNEAVASEVSRQGAKSRTSTQKVDIQNSDLVRGKDLDRIVDSINKMNLTSFIASKETWFSDLVDALYTLSKRMSSVAQDFDGKGVKSIEKSLESTAARFSKAVDSIKTIKIESDGDQAEVLQQIATTLSNLDFTLPNISVPTPEVTVNEREIDLSPIKTGLEAIKKAVDATKAEPADFSEVTNSVKAVTKAINSLRFPIPNYILPFKDPTTGKATQVTLDADGNLPISAQIETGDIEIGAVEIKNSTDDTRATVTANGLQVEPQGNVAAGATDSGNPVKIGGKYSSTLPTYTDGQRGNLQIGTRGALSVQIMGADQTTGLGIVASGADASSNTSSGLRQYNYNSVFNGSTWDRQRGDTTGTYTVGNVADAATDSGNPVKVGAIYESTLPIYTNGQRGNLHVGTRGSLHTTLLAADSNLALSSVVTNADGVAVSASANRLDAVAKGYVYNGTSWDRARGDTNGVYSVSKPVTSGGYTIFRSLDIDETEEEIKATAGQVYGWFIANNASSVRYIKFYNATAAGTTVGTTTPVLTLPIPANSAANVEFEIGIAFGTAITVAATTGVADADTGAPAANDCIINVFYT